MLFFTLNTELKRSSRPPLLGVTSETRLRALEILDRLPGTRQSFSNSFTTSIVPVICGEEMREVMEVIGRSDGGTSNIVE